MIDTPTKAAPVGGALGGGALGGGAAGWASACKEDLLRGLSAAQVAAVVSPAKPLCVLAGAGAGKTRVLTRRVAYRCHSGSADPRHVLVLTFTRKAAGELSLRLGQLGLSQRVAAGTFHSVATATLRRRWSDRGQRAPVLLERKSRLLGPLISSRPRLAEVALGALANEIEWAKARLVSPDHYEEAALAVERPTPAPAAELAALYARYEHEKRRRGLVDFDDLLSECADAIERDREFASAQHWRWRHLFVDEFQDVNPLQHRLLTAWLGTSVDLCVVGDPNQSIYGWNGSDPGLLASFGRAWPGGEVLRLDENHRCTPQVVRAASAVLGLRHGDGEPCSTRADGPMPTVRAYASELAEAKGVAFELRRARRDGLTWSEMAVLVRTNFQLAVLRSALQEAGVPFWDPSAAALLEHPAARLALQELSTAPGRSAQVAISDLQEMAEQAADADACAVLGTLSQLAEHYLTIAGPSDVASLLQWLPTATRSDSSSPSEGTVTLCSFHRAKGLEWRAVWLCGLESGLVPIAQATEAEARAEERRLLYVACTRAAERLHCSWAEQRSFGARPLRRQPSPWLHLLGAPTAEDSHPGSEERGRSPGGYDSKTPEPRFAQVRTALRSGRPSRRPLATARPGWPEPAPELVASLDTWRRQTARGSGVPAQAILHDRTLEALASLRPSNTAELLKVPGMGPVKANRFGERLIAIVAPAPERHEP